MAMTQYDKCVDSAMEVYRKEEREKKAAARLEQHQASHKSAARIWFNTLAEVWPPVMSEEYFEKTSFLFNRIWNENKDNKLLHELLVMTYQYLGEIAEERKRIESGTDERQGEGR